MNSKRDLAEAEKINRKNVTNKLMDSGVTIIDPNRVDVRGTLSCGQNVTIDVNTVFIGDVTLGDNVTIAPFTIVSNSVIGDGTSIHSHSNIDGADIGSNCNIGPYARIRPQTKLEEEQRLATLLRQKSR